eukprot:1226880-Prymnesium_polylepis.1
MAASRGWGWVWAQAPAGQAPAHCGPFCSASEVPPTTPAEHANGNSESTAPGSSRDVRSPGTMSHLPSARKYPRMRMRRHGHSSFLLLTFRPAPA